jgi:hypothetical protein
MAPIGHDTTVIEHQNAVGGQDRRQSMRDHERGSSIPQSLQTVNDCGFCDAVE